MHQPIDGLVHERRNSSVLAMELRPSCINPSIWKWNSNNIENWILTHCYNALIDHWLCVQVSAEMPINDKKNIVRVKASHLIGIRLPIPVFATAKTTVYPKKYAHGFVVLCFVVVTQSFIMNLHEVFIHIHQGCFAGIGAIVKLPQCQWSKPDGYGKISQCITTTKHSKAKTGCIFLGIYCNLIDWKIVINNKKNIVPAKVLHLIGIHLPIPAIVKAKSNLIDWKTKFYP